jgi:2-polyprenyl-3-methyl-5-hydroxy-6-metoxy-1,4-benzoquinol methylase
MKNFAKPLTETAAVREAYDENYFDKHCGPLPYNWGEPHWSKFFGKIADEIVRSLNPRTVLDVGCAVGFLADALWKRGVQAHGIDISEYAISKVPEALKPFCRVCSATDPLPEDFPRSYDLITCIEVLEHVAEHDAKAVIKNIAAETDCVLFSSTPDDLDEPTHVNVHPVTYWLALFAEVGFFSDLNFDASFVSPQAVLFRKGTLKVDDIFTFFAGSLERKFHLEQLVQTKKEIELRLERELNTRNARIETLEEEIARLNQVSHDLDQAKK